MTSRVGMVVSDVGPRAVRGRIVRAREGAERHPSSVPWLAIAAWVAALTLLLLCLPGRTAIAPVVESDYCYLLVAADRLVDGHGLTATPPVAPLQPWTYQRDWSYLTQWPCGYPLLVAGVRLLFGVATLAACRWIAVLACAAALVGWFAWVKRCVPSGVTGTLLAAVASGCAVRVAWLVNPTTDLLVTAAIPYVLLLTVFGIDARRQDSALLGDSARPRGTDALAGPRRLKPAARAWRLFAHGDSSRRERRTATWLFAAGLAAGGLFWFRYASVFVPVAIGAYLVAAAGCRRTVTKTQVAAFVLGAVLPMLGLLAVHAILGRSDSVQAGFNLGRSLALDLSPGLFATAWWNLTDLGFYDYRPLSHWAYALWPVGLAAVAIAVPPVRRALRGFFASPTIVLSGFVVASLLVMLVAATAVFGGKFDYVGLDRYYVAARPLYFVLFAAPALLVRWRAVRAAACVALLVAGSWIVQQEWSRPYGRWLAADRPVTPYGQRADGFGAQAADLYGWLREQSDERLIVLSNFHEYVTLETKIPGLPIPPNAEALDTWIERIRRHRGMTDPRVLFVLAPDNRWRDYWIPNPDKIVSDFDLSPLTDVPPAIAHLVWSYDPATSRTSVQRRTDRPPHGCALPWESYLRPATMALSRRPVR